ncbi:hypothetical protein FMM75_23170 [Lachnospiraceae bacterium MD335]|nr:hypothetical protein [Lachnospiraceae bacterium MD335]
MKGNKMGILYETARVTKLNHEDNEFSFNRSLESKEKNNSANGFGRTITNEFQEQKGQMPMEQVLEPQMPVRNYASIGSDVKKALEKAEQLDVDKGTPTISDYLQHVPNDSNERAVQQLTVHKTEAYGYFDELGKRFGKIAKNTETNEDDRYADALRGKLGAELANINSVSVGDVKNAFYELSK